MQDLEHVKHHCIHKRSDIAFAAAFGLVEPSANVWAAVAVACASASAAAY